MAFDVQDFAKDVLARSASVPVLVDFWAAWCAPCRVLGPVLEKLAGEAGGAWVLAKVDSDAHQDLAARYGVRGIPNVKLFVDGVVADEFSGALPEPAVRQWLERALPDPHRKEIERSELLLRSGNVEEARKVLGEIVRAAPENHHARVVLAGSLLGSSPEGASEMVRGIEEDSPYFAMADAISTFAALTGKLAHAEELPDQPVKGEYVDALRALAQGMHEEALQHFIAVIRQDRYYDDDGARKACVAIFKVLGDESEVTRTYRRAFSSALFV